VVEPKRYRVDDLRRLGAAMLSALGLEPARASAFVAGLLWYEAADAPSFGIASLSGWLDAIESGEIDPKSEGTIVREHTATAVLDARRGLDPLILARAARIAGEKAREVGAGMVHVAGLTRFGATAEVASEVAVGPMIGTITGPMGSLSVAVPVEGTTPAVFDTALAPEPWTDAPPWAAEPVAGWLVTARAVSAFESLAAVHEHVETLLRVNPPFPGEVRPDAWRARRLEHIERGLTLDEATESSLRDRAGRLGLNWPA
jgi:LDH2 family malate/lactate/ureidoglycolate dehydrogenase